jgi:galactokinase
VSPRGPASTPPPGAALHGSAPGRVNLIGEHTDYNEGYVLPVPIPQQTHVELGLREDRRVSVRSTEQVDAGEYELGAEARRGGWLDYVQGVTRALRSAGHGISGFTARISSTVPMGAGLSSSAALEVALLRALRTAFSLPLSDVDIARLGQASEVDFVGVPVGIMDQMACSVGRPGRALFLDTRTLETRDVPVPQAFELVVIASGLVHAHDAGDYRTRRAECEQAVQRLGCRSLRDVTLDELERNRALDPVLRKRARHVISENARVLETVEALQALDRSRLRTLFMASHASMRDDYQVSVAEIDRLVALAEQTPGVIGARLTGGGFGGSVVMLAEREGAADAARSIASSYQQETGRTPRVLLPLETDHAAH